MIKTLLMTFDEKGPPSSAGLFTADIPPAECSLLLTESNMHETNVVACNSSTFKVNYYLPVSMKSDLKEQEQVDQ